MRLHLDQTLRRGRRVGNSLTVEASVCAQAASVLGEPRRCPSSRLRLRRHQRRHSPPDTGPAGHRGSGAGVEGHEGVTGSSPSSGSDLVDRERSARTAGDGRSAVPGVGHGARRGRPPDVCVAPNVMPAEDNEPAGGVPLMPPGEFAISAAPSTRPVSVCMLAAARLDRGLGDGGDRAVARHGAELEPVRCRRWPWWRRR